MVLCCRAVKRWARASLYHSDSSSDGTTMPRRRRRRKTKVAAALPGEQSVDHTRRSLPGGWVCAASLPRTPDGRTRCRWCGGGVDPPRRTFCSDGCVFQHRIRTQPSFLRRLVWQRDRGVCRYCGVDTTAQAQAIRRAVTATERSRLRRMHGIPPKRRVNRRRFGGGLFDVDHVVPVCLGGGCRGLEYVVTACLLCHRGKTAMLRKRRRYLAELVVRVNDSR